MYFTQTLQFYYNFFATITITSATAEISFPSLRRLKNYMTPAMTEDRLNGLTVLNIPYEYKEISIGIDKVINRFY